MDYYIGIDIGTSSTKAVAFNVSGETLAQHAIHYPILHPAEDRSEQEPAVIVAAVISCLQYTATQLPQHNPVLVSFSAAMHSLILVDKYDTLLTDCIIWADNRASKLAVALRETTQGKSFYQLSGVPVHAMSPLCKIAWLKENEPLLFNKAAKFIGIKEYIFYQLFGKYIIDTGIASATSLLNIHSLQWEDSILAYTGIVHAQLSAIVPTTHIEYLPQEKVTGQTVLSAFKNTAFVIGSSDGALANLGSGATIAGSMAVTIGTSGAVRVVTQQVITDADMRTFCYHLTGQRYIVGGASNNGAVVIQWLKENILQNKNSFDTFLDSAATIPAGCDGLLFLPYILGERAPIWNSMAKGVFFGLDASHTTAHLVRAAMEAVVYNMYAIGKILMEKKTVDIIYANGGFTDNTFWIQLLADMFALPVYVPPVEEISALGAVIIGMQALNLPSTFQQPTGKIYQPNVAYHAVYLAHFAKWQRLYEAVKSEF